MNLLDLMIKIGVDDRASGEIDSIANEATGKFSGAAGTIGGAARAIGTTMVAVTGAAVAGAVSIGKAALDGYAQFEQMWGGVQKLYGTAGQSLDEFAKTATRTTSDIESADIDWDKYANTNWFKMGGVDAIFDDIQYNVDELGTSFEDLTEYLHMEYDLDTEDAQKAIRAYQDALTDDNIQKKYERQQKAQELVLENAMSAYKTAGMSANEYMETATSFSASLISSLGGDTMKAAEQTDVAMRAMSDNVNTFGTDMQSVQYAFQGFAKQNYTMLDNLKLGYGGTKEEMERLIEDANKYAKSIGQAGDLSMDSFSDIVTAIELVQEKQGIAGTTAREAASTIEGSVNMAKAAWSNWVTELGKDNADMEARTQELVDSLVTAAGNIVPRITTIAGTLIRTLPTAISQLGSSLLPAVVELGGSLLAAVGDIVTELVTNVIPNSFTQIGEMFSNIDMMAMAEELRLKLEEGVAYLYEWLSHGGADMLNVSEIVFQKIGEVTNLIMENIPTFIDSIGSVTKAIGETLLISAPNFLKQAGTFFSNFLKSIGDNAPKWMQSFSNAVKNIIDLVIQNGPDILKAAADFFGQILHALIENAPKILSALLSTLVDLIGYIITHIPEILAAAVEFFGSILGALLNAIPQILAGIGGLILDAVNAIAGGVGDMLNAGVEFVGGLLDGAARKGREVIDWFANLPNNILNALGDLGSWLVEKGRSLLTGMWNGAVSMGNDLLNWFANIPNNILRAIGGLGDLLWTAGHNVLTGFWNGMIGVWNDLTGWIGGIGQWIADHKGPKEYDLRLLVKNGGWIMDGLGSGMRDAFEGDVLPYVESMADEISKAMQPDAPLLSFDKNRMADFSNDLVVDGYSHKEISITIERMEVRDDQDVYELSRSLADLVNREESAALWTL